MSIPENSVDPEAPIDPERYMATDQLVLVANAELTDEEILDLVNKVLEERGAPLNLSFTPPSFTPSSSESETSEGESESSESKTSENEGENDPSSDSGRAVSSTLYTSAKALDDTGSAAMAEPPLVTPNDPLGSISIVSPEPSEAPPPVTPSEPSEVPLSVTPPEPIDISTVEIPTMWELSGIVVRSLSFFTKRRSDNGGSEERITQEEIIQSVLALDEAISPSDADGDTNGDGEADAPVKTSLNGVVVAASPNWLMVTAPPEQTGFGGPGTEPVLVPNTQLAPQYKIQFTDSTTPTLMQTLADINLGEGVTIVILDSSPAKDLFEAVAPGSHNPLMRSLSGKLHFHTHPENETELQPPPPSRPLHYVHAPDHDYDMKSHGIFVAGLIHSIIPKAELHLVRVLDDHGVGTLTTIQRGLEIAYQLKKTKGNNPFLLNCSLTMVFPYLEQQGIEALPDWLKAREDIWNALAAEQQALKQMLEDTKGLPRATPPLALPTTLTARLRYVMELAIRTTAQAGILMVAAAGNERNTANSSSPLPMTLYPAAFDEVVGVGALKSTITFDPVTGNRIVKFASYSCSVDKPAHEGFAVLGGDTNESGIVNRESGLLGVWLDEGAAVAQNRCWRRWAGTSFAAPIITGALALLMASGKDQREALEALYEGWIEKTDPPARIDTPQVVLAKQG